MEIDRKFVEIDQVYVDIDISKEFDRVDHGISIPKLSNLRIHGKPLNWFVMYSIKKVTFRTQRLRSKGTSRKVLRLLQAFLREVDQAPRCCLLIICIIDTAEINNLLS